MQLKTILNRVLKHSAFVYVGERLVETLAGPTVEVELRARANSRPRCRCCGRPGPGYDTLAQRRFEFVPLWGIRVFFLYAPRRVNCASCGIRVEALPWAAGKHRLTTAYAWFLARWAKRRVLPAVVRELRRFVRDDLSLGEHRLDKMSLFLDRNL